MKRKAASRITMITDGHINIAFLTWACVLAEDGRLFFEGMVYPFRVKDFVSIGMR
ncbi:MAG: hypothetical protein HFH82_10870 [Lachnospiraceae bacterium]|nr:hypothetical protein [Lachnospiraceae bacterium]